MNIYMYIYVYTFIHMHINMNRMTFYTFACQCLVFLRFTYNIRIALHQLLFFPQKAFGESES